MSSDGRAEQTSNATFALVAAAGRDTVGAIGVDAVDIEEFKRDLQLGGDAFLAQIFSKDELQHCAGDVEKLAGRFALKEAALKALGTGIRGIGLRDVEIYTRPEGQPELRLSAAAHAVARTRQLDALRCSATHESNLALAVVVASHHRISEEDE